jgi:RNA polymerase sigma-70 factor, ECF subfamily
VGFLLAIARRTFANYGVRDAGQDAEDAVADVWKNLLEKDRRIVRDCSERGNFLQTLQVLTRNRSVDILRRRHEQVVSLDQGQAAAQAAAPTDNGPAIPPEQMRAAMQVLTQRERTLVNLFFLQGKKYREIADLTGIPQNSIGPTLARALARLRKQLGEL